MGKIIFSDFDGTITKVDTCNAMVDAFAQESWKEINRLWEKQEISTQECINRMFRIMKITPGELDKLLMSIEIDEGFQSFLSFIKDKGYPFYVLSDGYDHNIKTILNRYQIHVPYYANNLVYNGQYQVKCPYQNESCGQCGTCKTNLIRKLSNPGDEIIYIGDGYSDLCPARYADKVYAKGTLLRYCRENGIAATAFKTFNDILELIG